MKKAQMQDIKGQEHVKRAIEVAAAGNHSILIIGPPQCGKKLLLDQLQRLNPYYSAYTHSQYYCGCGYHKQESRECFCTPEQIMNYRLREIKRLKENISIYVQAYHVKFKILFGKYKAEENENIIKRIAPAIETQKERLENELLSFNEDIPFHFLDKYCGLDDDCLKLADMVVTRLTCLPGEIHSMMRVARTIADLDQAENISPIHLSEAIQYRKQGVDF